MKHYLKIGVRSFVFIDNNSNDGTLEKIESYAKPGISIEIYETDKKFGCNRQCGWIQQIINKYGENRWYLCVDSDELFVLPNHKSTNINSCLDKLVSQHFCACKSIMLDIYPKKPLFSANLNDYQYVDANTYHIDERHEYGLRFYGGPRKRTFGIAPNLQKTPLFYYTGNELFINNHYLYPYKLNNIELSSFLLHYKFMKGDYTKYKEAINDKVYWNNSAEYKVYPEKYSADKKLSFYDKEISVNIDRVTDLRSIL